MPQPGAFVSPSSPALCLAWRWSMGCGDDGEAFPPSLRRHVSVPEVAKPPNSSTWHRAVLLSFPSVASMAANLMIVMGLGVELTL